MSARYPDRRPSPVSLAPVTAWLLDVYVRQGHSLNFRSWVLAQRASKLFTAADRATVLANIEDLAFHGGWYRDSLTSDLGSSERLESVPAARLSHEISAREAAGMLQVSDRWVRQLCAEGVLDARRDGWSWLIDRASVELHERRAA